MFPEANRALLPSYVIDFCNVPRSEILAGKGFIVRCHVEVINESARCWEEISSYKTTVLVKAVCSLLTFTHFDHLVLQKFYKVPPYSKEIPYTRVNHNKFMVTDSVAYIGTSNWSANYFTGTAGIGYVINETETGNTLRAQLQAVFERNWDSNFTISVNGNQ